ncbi:Phosphoacetylglucosamine Mutase [Tulasnella sp. 419]|nr:Phosphoacetylglucosamine Mutase [Tulasnella sp. 419]
MSRQGVSGNALKHYSDLHPKPPEMRFQYGTAGFRMNANNLDCVLFRVGVLAALRSKRLDGRTVGVMVTASHNPEHDNGVKLVDPRGEMLEAAWEAHATTISNAETTDDFIESLQALVLQLKIDLTRPARVLYARDTRPSGPLLVKALEDGIKAMDAEGRDAGVTTTPILHYLVRCVNTKDTKEHYGEDSVEGYMTKMSTAFKKLMKGKPTPPELIVDCANGVGYYALESIANYLGPTLKLSPYNHDFSTPGALNHNAGADYVKTQQRFPPAVLPALKAGQRAASFDGDADRLIYYYLDDREQFRLLDGDKIAALVAGFIVDLVKGAGLEGKIDVGVVQTAYANGSSTRYLSQRLPVKCVPTGVKHLHHAAEHFDVGIYFEANGHGTVLFSPRTLELLASHEPNTPAQATCIEHLQSLTELINQTVGDALSDLLLVEVVLAHRSYTALEWDSAYTDLPNRLVKVHVKDRNSFTTEDAERRLVTPQGLQTKVDDIVKKYDGGRSFVRASGTEDAVRVYAEAVKKSHAEELAYKVAGLVYDEAGGSPSSKPREFL